MFATPPVTGIKIVQSHLRHILTVFFMVTF